MKTSWNKIGIVAGVVATLVLVCTLLFQFGSHENSLKEDHQTIVQLAQEEKQLDSRLDEIDLQLVQLQVLIQVRHHLVLQNAPVRKVNVQAKLVRP